MINLDTNVLLRVIVRDDVMQTPQAEAFLSLLTSEKPGYISLVSLAELTGVLRRFYRRTPVQIAAVVEGLLNSSELELEKSETIARALILFRAANAEWQDCLVAQSGLDAACEYTVTFDKNAAKLPGMRLLGGPSA